MRQLLAITRKELENYFGSPLALIFLGSFIAVVLFIFFTVETFFARNVADVRPLFRWMPLLLVFLLAALTMRQWSEEQRAGTLEVLLTLPVRPLDLVLGKFLAVMALIGVALTLTLPLPITVTLLGNLDWGPVIGGYLAALLLAAAYAALGLFVSSRTDNQIVALIVSVLLGGVLVLIGTPAVTDFFSGSTSRLLWALGTGSRFESIERGVVDLRDLVYYLSQTIFFLLLNVVSIDSKRWSRQQVAYRRRMVGTAVLIAANLVLLNIWLSPLQGLRADLTAQKEYSLSPTTYDLVDNLQEPLLMRAYISERTHPLLAPLVPRIEDLLREYEIAGDGMINTELVDPVTDPELENEANQVYGIQPRPFQIADRYEATVINSYFHILLQYGDQVIVLSFEDLVQIVNNPNGSTDAQLRNLEYDLTRGIKRVLFGFQSIDSVLNTFEEPVELTLFITPDSLPEWMVDVDVTMSSVAQQIAAESNGKLLFSVVNPDDPNSSIDRTFLLERYGLPGIPTDLLSEETYYAHMLLAVGDKGQFIYPSGDINEAGVRTAIESALKRSTTGFLKVIGVWTPPQAPLNDPILGNVLQPMASYQALQQQLGQEYTLQTVDLSSGQVPAEIDVLLLIAPSNFTDAELFAVDQYLMRGGSVVVATSNFGLAFDNFTQGFSLYPLQDSLQQLLAHYGVNIGDGIVMDAQNSPFPVVSVRSVQGSAVQEIQAVDYPFFVDVRADGMDGENVITSNIPAVTLSYSAPVELDPALNAERETAVLLSSSPNAWLRMNEDITPNFALYPETGFPVGNTLQQYPLAVSVQGRFESYFRDRALPGQEDLDEGSATMDELLESSTPRLTTIPQSPDTARLVVIGSGSFMEDLVMELTAVFQGEGVFSNLQLVQNSVDWAVEDLDLLAIRARGTAVRLLDPLGEDEERLWEAANYAVALLALAGIFVIWRLRRQTAPPLIEIHQPEGAAGETAVATGGSDE